MVDKLTYKYLTNLSNNLKKKLMAKTRNFKRETIKTGRKSAGTPFLRLMVN